MNGYVAAGAVLLILLAAALLSRWRTECTIKRLDEMLTDAMEGRFSETNFDESRLSALECRLGRYLAAIAREPSVIIPTGSCEIYGPHLPMGTDLLAAQGIAERIAQRTGFLIAPAIETGESSALRAFPCTFAMPRHILEDYLDFLVGKLVSDGVKRIVFLTGHAGNVDTVSYIAKKYLHTHGLQSCQIDWWRFARTHSDGILTNTGSMAHGHASECGTSVMLHLYPDLVDRRSALPVTVPTDDAVPDVIQYAPFSARTENGCIGAAADASAEKGAQLVEVCVERILAYLETVWDITVAPGD